MTVHIWITNLCSRAIAMPLGSCLVELTVWISYSMEVTVQNTAYHTGLLVAVCCVGLPRQLLLPEGKMYLFCSRHCSLTLNLGEWLPKGAGVKNTEGNQEVLNFYFKFTWERLKVFCIKSKQLFSSKMACNLQAKNNHTRKSEAPLTPWRSATESWKEAKHHQNVWQWFLNPTVTPMPGPDS